MLWGVGRFLLLGFPPLASCLCAFLDGPAPLLAVAVHLRLECGEERAHIEVGQQAVEHLVPVAPAAVGLPAVVEQCLEELPRLLVVEFVEDAAHGVVVDDERLLPLAPGSGGVVVWFHNDSFFKGLTKKGFLNGKKGEGGRAAVRCACVPSSLVYVSWCLRAGGSCPCRALVVVLKRRPGIGLVARPSAA